MVRFHLSRKRVPGRADDGARGGPGPSLKEQMQQRRAERERALPKRFEYTEGEPLLLAPQDTTTKCARPGCGRSREEHGTRLPLACIRC